MAKRKAAAVHSTEEAPKTAGRELRSRKAKKARISYADDSSSVADDEGGAVTNVVAPGFREWQTSSKLMSGKDFTTVAKVRQDRVL